MPGFAAEQVAQIDPRFVHFAHEFRKVTKKVKGPTERRQKTRMATVDEPSVKVVGGKAVLTTNQVQRRVPVFTDHPVFDAEGKPVMVEAQPEIRDRKGRLLQPRIMRQAVHQEPVMEEVASEVEETLREQVSKKARPDGVQYAALVVPLIKTVQDLEARLRKLEA